MTDTYKISNVEALWPKINTTYAFDQKANKSMPCNATDNNAEYSIQFRMNNDQAKELFLAMSKSYQANKQSSWAEKLERPFVKDDDGTFTYKATLKGAYKSGPTTKPLQVDAKGNKLPDDFLLTTGSTVNIAVQFYPYDFGGKQNISLRLKAVQVVKHVPMEDRNPFDVVEGFDITDSNPFANGAVVNVTAEDAEIVEEPKKVVKKSAPPPTETDDDLSAIVDNWDD